MTETQPLDPLLHFFFFFFFFFFFADHLIIVKGRRPALVRSYGDTIRLFLVFAARSAKIIRISLDDLTTQQVTAFLRHLEQDRSNHARTRDQRLAALHTLFEYIAGRSPEMLPVCQ
jgi:integrase/recombinase XerD